ncbi:MAG TPA: hypothetical protein ENN17_09290 [bacterium]|nr:hypothetical protein [bacterium]
MTIQFLSSPLRPDPLARRFVFSHPSVDRRDKDSHDIDLVRAHRSSPALAISGRHTRLDVPCGRSWDASNILLRLLPSSFRSAVKGDNPSSNQRNQARKTFSARLMQCMGGRDPPNGRTNPREEPLFYFLP